VATLLVKCWWKVENANEYAFAMGALAHYASDINGHPSERQKAKGKRQKAKGKRQKALPFLAHLIFDRQAANPLKFNPLSRN